MPSEKNLNYKLSYFNCRGFGEPIRLIFHYCSIPFEDVRFTHFYDGQKDWFEKWQKELKPSKIKKKDLHVRSFLIDFPYGQVPVLEFETNGERKMLSQSQTICRFLANKYGLAGKNEWEKAMADELAEYMKDLRPLLLPYFKVLYGWEEGDLEEKRRTVLQPSIYEKLVPVLIRNLKESGSGFLLPSGLSWIDFISVESCITFNGFDEGEMFKKYPELEEYVKRVHSANESLRKYIAGRNTTKV